MKRLIFLLTLRCPLECEHCAVGSNPRRSEVIDDDRVLAAIEQAAEAGVEEIGFTGGEPFIAPKSLLLFHERASSLGLRTVIITSAFFGTSVANAKRILTPFRGVALLGISADRFHARFVALDKIRNVLIAAKELGMGNVEVQAVITRNGDADAVVEMVSSEFSEIAVRTQPAWPVGPAAALDVSAIDRPLEKIDPGCPMVGPLVLPSGRVVGCCSALLSLDEADNPLSYGNIADGVANIAERVSEDPYYATLRSMGVLALSAIARSNGEDEILEGRYTDSCHFCCEFHSHKRLRALASQAMRSGVPVS